MCQAVAASAISPSTVPGGSRCCPRCAVAVARDLELAGSKEVLLLDRAGGREWRVRTYVHHGTLLLQVGGCLGLTSRVGRREECGFNRMLVLACPCARVPLSTLATCSAPLAVLANGVGCGIPIQPGASQGITTGTMGWLLF